MKLLIFINALIFMVNGLTIKQLNENNLEAVPANICLNQPSGTTFPVLSDCSEFILCISSNMVHSRCPTTTPFFDPCTSMCSSSSYVCFRTHCYETTTRTDVPTTLPTDPTTTILVPTVPSPPSSIPTPPPTL